MTRAGRSRLAVLALELACATAGVLADPSDLTAYVSAADLVDDAGDPSPERIKSTALALVERKAHLAPRPAILGDVDQGAPAPGPEAFDLAGALRAAVG